MTSLALTWLYVPGDRPDRYQRALGSGADVVIVDLEDSVHPDHKSMAREAVAELLTVSPTAPIEVRINDLDSPWGADDLARLGGLPGFRHVRVPKVRGRADIGRVVHGLPGDRPIALTALIESALGVEAAFEIASESSVAVIGLGEADLRSELGVTDDQGLSYARGRIVNAARAADLRPPAMSPWMDVSDPVGLAASSRQARGLGFLGRAAIHPDQLPIIAEAFTPDDDEVSAARALLDELSAASALGLGGLVLTDGRFVDRAMVALAERIVDLARRGSPSS